MNIDTFKVLNSVRKLGFTEEDCAAMEKESRLNTCGIGVVAKQGEWIAYYDHDEKERGVCVGRAEGKLVGAPIPSRVLCKTLITFMDIPREVNVLHRALRYNRRGDGDSEIRFRADNISELRDRLFKRFEEKQAWTKYMTEEDLEAFFWLIGTPYPETFDKPRLDFATIIHMEERGNKRIAVFSETEEKTEKHGMFYSAYNMPTGQVASQGFYVRIYTMEDEEYNLICKGREVYRTSRSIIFMDDDMTGKLTGREMMVVENTMRVSHTWRDDTSDKILVLDERKYRQVQSSSRTQLMTAQREAVLKDTQQKYDGQAWELFKGAGYVRWGIKFQRNRISKDRLAIEGPDIEKFVHENRYLPGCSVSEGNMTIEEIAENYVNMLLKRSNRNLNSSEVISRFEGKADITIGRVKMTVSRDDRRRFHIGGHQIREVEIDRVILMGLYVSQSAFEAKLPSISRMGFRMIEAVRDGVSIEIRLDNIHGCDMKMPIDRLKLYFKVKWEKNRAWLVHDGKDYAISRSDCFFKLGDCRSYREDGSAIDQFCKRMHNAVPTLPHSEIGKLIEECDRRFLERIRKSESFLANAVKLTGSLYDKEAYYVTGESGIKYMVKPDLTVYKLVPKKSAKNEYNAENVCLRDVCSSVDDEAAVNDRIAARLLALNKDKSLAGEIYSRGDHVQEFWKDIAR